MPIEKNVNVRVPEEVKKDWLMKLAERGVSGTAVLNEFVRRWTYGHVEQSNAYPHKDRKWHDALQAILDDAYERPGIEANLRWGLETVKRKHPDPPAGQTTVEARTHRPTKRASGQ